MLTRSSYSGKSWKRESGGRVALKGRVGIHTKCELSLQDLVKQVKAHKRFGDVGGIGIFIGVTRSSSAHGEPVSHLELEAYERKAEEAMASITDDISNRAGIVDVQIHHVVGKLEVGDLIMAVLVAGKSRKDVFPALIEAVERTKSSVPIWKKEFLLSGESYWVSERNRASGSSCSSPRKGMLANAVKYLSGMLLRVFGNSY